MPEQITLQQISEMMRQEFVTQTAHIVELVDQKLAALETRMDQKLDALETRMDQKFADLKEYVDDAAHQAIESAVAIVQSNFEKYADRIINRGHALVENVEGKQIRLLNELTRLHEETLDNREDRIHKLEEAAV